MEYTCPICGDKLYKINCKLVCGRNECDFQCLVEEYQVAIQPWNIQKCKDTSLWNDQVFDLYPYIISKEYKRLYDLLDQGKLYGVLFQIKDVFEVLLKFPTILALSRYCNNKKRGKEENEIIQFLLDNMLSLGHWNVVARKCILINGNNQLTSILTDITRIYEENNITKWRNNTLGHGALLFDDTQEFKEDVEKKIRLIKLHFDNCNKEYLELKFLYKSKGKTTTLRGIQLDNNILKPQGNLSFRCGESVCEINNMMKIHNNGVYFFDTYMKWDKKTKMLNYVDADMIALKLKYFEELFKNISKSVRIERDVVSDFEDEIYIESEEDTINLIDTPEEVIEPTFIKEWLEKKLNENSKGIYLLQMEEGMGKTTFSRMLDPHAKNKISFKGVTIRTYYINCTYSFKPDIFQNNIIEILQLNDNKTDRIKGNIPRFKNNTELESRKEFASIIENFRRIYQDKYGKDKVLIIIDGVDEIPVLQGKSILNYIPEDNDLEEKVHILITSRSRKENPEYINTTLDTINFTDRIEVLRTDEEYISILNKFLEKKLCISNSLLIENIIKKSDNRFIYIRPIEYILKFRNIDNVDNIDIFDEFLKILESNYTEKYYTQIVDLLIVLTIAREGLSINEISYLLNGKLPDFKLLAYLTDVSCLLMKERTYRGTIISLSHASLKEFILRKYKDRIGKIIDRWISEVKDMEFSNIGAGQRYLIFNSIYFTEKFNPFKLQELINCKNMNIATIYKTFANNKITKYEIHQMIDFMDDFICALETNTRMNAKNLVFVYILRMQAFMKYGFGGDNLYYNYIDKALELFKIYNIKNDALIIEAYKLRSEYYRRVGNIKKSLDDNKVIGDYLANSKSKNFNKIKLSLIDNVCMLHRQSINLKNLGEVEEAIKIALKAKEIIQHESSLDGRCIYSDVLNNLGLCYLKENEVDLAEENIRTSLDIIKDINEKFKFRVDGIFYNYANLGQVLRKKKRLDDALEVYNKSIEAIINQETEGYLVDGNQKALQYNGRANIYRDLAVREKNAEFYNKVIEDYLNAIKIIENMDDQNQDLRLLFKLYANVASLYKNNLNNLTEAELYKNKCTELGRKSFRSQLDLIDEDDIEIDDKINYIEGTKNYERGNKLFERRKCSEAIQCYEIAVTLLNKLSNKEDMEVREILASIHYNKAACAHLLLEEKLSSDYYSMVQGKVVIKNYDKLKPQEIINDYLICESSVTLDDKQKCQMYKHISYIYCEIMKEYEDAKVYALKAIELDKEDENGHFCLGNAYFELNKFEQAIKSYERALELIPEHPGAQTNLILARLKLEEETFRRYFNMENI